MRIGEVATKAGVSVRSLRYYEEQGLLSSTRSPSGQRLYGDHEVERITFIQRLYAAGLSSRTIIELLPCVVSPGAENSDAALQRMGEERDRISTHITDLMNTRDALDALIEANRAHCEPSPDRPLAGLTSAMSAPSTSLSEFPAHVPALRLGKVMTMRPR